MKSTFKSKQIMSITPIIHPKNKNPQQTETTRALVNKKSKQISLRYENLILNFSSHPLSIIFHSNLDKFHSISTFERALEHKKESFYLSHENFLFFAQLKSIFLRRSAIFHCRDMWECDQLVSHKKEDEK